MRQAQRAAMDSKWLSQFPEGLPGPTLLSVELDLPVDAAFLLLYGGLSDMQVRRCLAARLFAPALAPAACRRRPLACPPAAQSPAGWRGRRPQKALNEAVGNRDYSTTAWLPSLEEAEAAALKPSPPPLDAGGLAALRPGWLRRASYSGSMMGSKVGAGERRVARGRFVGCLVGAGQPGRGLGARCAPRRRCKAPRPPAHRCSSFLLSLLF